MELFHSSGARPDVWSPAAHSLNRREGSSRARPSFHEAALFTKAKSIKGYERCSVGHEEVKWSITAVSQRDVSSPSSKSFYMWTPKLKQTHKQRSEACSATCSHTWHCIVTGKYNKEKNAFLWHLKVITFWLIWSQTWTSMWRTTSKLLLWTQRYTNYVFCMFTVCIWCLTASCERTRMHLPKFHVSVHT